MKQYKFIGKSCWLEKEKVLVISDLHLGYEEMLAGSGVFLPRLQYRKIIEEMDLIFDAINKLKEGKKKLVNKKTINNFGGKLIGGNFVNNKRLGVKEIVILGDLKHEFSQASSQEWKEVLDLLAYLKEKCGKIILIKGNHDNYLINIAKKQGIKVVDYYIKKVGKEKICFLHGHRLFDRCLDKDIKSMIMGHMHPAVSIRKHAKEEKYKCFLAGKWKNKEVVILPSFFPLVEGADVSISDTNLDKRFDFKLSGFEVYVPAGLEVLNFGKLKGVGRLV